MPLFQSKGYENYTQETIEFPKDIPKHNDRPNIIVPSFVVSLSQKIISFVLRKSSKLPFIGTKNGDIREFTVDEFHILAVLFLGLSIHYTRKYRKESKIFKRQLEKLMIDSKIHNFETLAAVDHNNVQRIECLYYKNQFVLYDIDLLTRTELRSFIQQILAQCEVLSGLSIKILESVNTMFHKQRKTELRSLYQQKLSQNDFKHSIQQKLKNDLRHKENAIDEYFDRTEETVDKYHAFFDEKNNEQYLTEIREELRQLTEREVMDAYKDQNEQKQIEINASKMSSANVENSSEEDEENTKTSLQRRRQILNLEMNYDHEFLIKQADSLPIEQIDFNCKQISRYNLQKIVNGMKYDIILNQDKERRTEQIRKYGIITLIVATSTFTYWYNKYYKGKGIGERIRDTKSRLFSYF